MASEPPVCPRCGSPVAAGQEICIECGARLGGRSLPAGWLVPALAALAVAAGAAAVVLAIGRDDGTPPVVAPPLVTTSTAAATASAAVTTAATTAATTPRTTARSATATARPTTTAPSPATTAVAATTTATSTTMTPGLVTWPARVDGFTVVIASLPRAVGVARARARALEAARRGLPQTGVLDSDAFASLHPGYLVIFSGVYATLDAAQRAAAAAQRLFPGAYARRITR